MSSIYPSRSTSLSRASSSDPINLLDFGQKSQLVSTSIYPERYLQKTKQLAVFTWPDFRAATRRSKAKHLLAKNLPHTLLDNMNAMHAYFRSLPMNRTIFEETISDNTMDDEPDAPPIRIINDIDDEPTPPWEFYYTNQMWHGDGVPPPDMKSLPSCDCVGSCDPKSDTCACLKRQQEFTLEFTPDFAYDRRGRLKQNDIPIFECNELCGCDDDCRNRVSIVSVAIPSCISIFFQVVQRGRKCVVNIGKTKEKGWGAVTHLFHRSQD
jgi:histone-lysine N-methyltransferase SUV39H